MRNRFTLALAVTVLVSAGARAAATPDPLLAAVPDGALAVALARSSVARLRPMFDKHEAMRADLSAFLTRTVGLDLVEADSFVAWSTQLQPTPTWAALVHLPKSGALHGQKSGSFEGVDLIKLAGTAVAASVPAGLLVGDESEVKRAILVAKKKAGALGASSILMGPLSDKAADLVIVLDPVSVAGDIAKQFGAQVTSLVVRGRQLALEVSGDGTKLQLAQALVNNAVAGQLAELKAKMDASAKGDDIGQGISDITAYHGAQDAWKELQPKLTGNKLVFQYTFPETGNAQFLAMAGVGAAVAIPAFTKYERRSKTVEATTNLRLLSDAARAKKKARFPKSTAWTPAKPCCQQPGAKCQPDPQAWKAPAWKALDFSVAEPSNYQYRVVTEGKGAAATMSVEARGDLDCDGTYSSFKRTLRLENGDLVDSGLESKDEIE
jgi:hypothetical protein